MLLGERRFISLSLPAPGAGARMPADPRPQTWREGRSPALAPLPLLMGTEGRAGEDGWRAVPPGPRFITDTKPRRRPRLIRKSAGAAAGPPGAPRAPLPRAPGSVRARRFFARSLPFARPPPRELPAVPSVSGSHRATHSACARAASSRTPGAAPRGGRWWRRGGEEIGGHRFAARAEQGGRSSKLGAAAGGVGRKGCWGPVERAESPARPSIVPLFLYSSLRPLLAVVGGVRMRALCPRCFGRAAHPQTWSRSRPHRRRSHRPREDGACRVSAALSPHRRRLPGPELFLQLFFAIRWKLWLLGSRFFGDESYLAFWRG